MSRGSRKLLSVMLCITVVITSVIQSFVPVYGYSETRTGQYSWAISSGDLDDDLWEGTFEIVDQDGNPVKPRDIFDVTCNVIEQSVVDEVYKESVTYNVYGNLVEFIVKGGMPTAHVYSITKKVRAIFPDTIYEMYDGKLVQFAKLGDSVNDVQEYGYNTFIITKKLSEVGVYPSYINDEVDGKIVRFEKKGSPENLYQTYEYIVKITYTYSHKLAIGYTYNEAPQITEIIHPAANKSFNDTQNSVIHIEGTVEDKNVGDKLEIMYSIDKYDADSDSIDGYPIGSGIITSDGSGQKFSGSIDIKSISGYKELDQSIPHTLYIWAVDSKNKKSPATSINSIPFYIDTIAPDAPILDKDPDYVTKDDVTVTITYPDDVDKKEYKIGPDGPWEIYTSPIPISVNTEVYARGTDEAGNTSNESSIVIDNIDKEKPSEPIINANPEKSNGEPIVVSIQPGKDNRTSVCEVVYAVVNNDRIPDDSEYVLYEGEFQIKDEGNYVIWAKTVDEAGNLSDEAHKVISIIKPTPTPTPVASPSSPVVPINSPVNPPANTPSTSPASTPSSSGSTSTPAPVTPIVTAPTNKVPAIALDYDLAVFLTSDKRAYGENEVIPFTISYKNKLSSDASDVVINAQIPQYTTVEDAGGGVVSGDRITWNLNTVLGNGDGKIVYKLKVGLLDKAEVYSSIIADITASGKNVYDLDDKSVYPVLLYSNRFGDNQHKKYVIGYEDNTFRPENSITRAEVAAMLSRVLDLPSDTPGNKVYTDVPQQHWAYGYIYAATKNGLFEGYVDNTFKPDAYITRAELSTALARYLKLENVEPTQFHFKDISKHWARNYIEEIYRLKLIAGYQDGTFLPDAKIKRVETVTIINRMLYRGPLNGAVVSFTDVKKDYWAYGHIAECSLDHFFTRNNDALSSETLVIKDAE